MHRSSMLRNADEFRDDTDRPSKQVDTGRRWHHWLGALGALGCARALDTRTSTPTACTAHKHTGSGAMTVLHTMHL